MNQHRQALEQFFFLADGPRWLIRGPSHPSPRHRFEHVEVERLLDDDGKGFYRKRFLKTASGADYSYWTEREIRFVSHFASLKTPQVARPKLVEYGSAAVKQVDTQDAGPSLDNWLKLRVSPANRPDRAGPLFAEVAEVARLLCACINALHELHRHGIVHCDIKADNICLGYVGAPLGEDGLRLDYDSLSLIDFAFSVWPGSRTWELAQALPIDPDALAADYVSPFFKAVLREDRHQQPPQAWQRLNYSVDWYALAVMLRKLLQLLDSQRRDISGENPLESFLYGLTDEWQTQYANGEIPATLPHPAEIARIQARFPSVKNWGQSEQLLVRVEPTPIPPPPPPTPLITPLPPPPNPTSPPWVLIAIVSMVLGGLGYFGIAALQVKWSQYIQNENEDATAQFNLGLKYYNGNGVIKDPAQAVTWWNKAAEQGHADAQYWLGLMYGNGEGVTKNFKQQLAWYTKAAKQGHADAQNNLGYMYAHGEGVAKDSAQAVSWYRKAAEQGNAVAQDNLGLMYAKGEGVEENPKQAEKWWSKAASQGNADAQFNLGWRYAKGKGVEKNLEQAVKLLRQAAEQNASLAQNYLGKMYENGDGVSKNLETAIQWYRKAAANGKVEAKESLKRLGK